jgi:hypothetical protein
LAAAAGGPHFLGPPKAYGRDIAGRDDPEKKYDEWIQLGCPVPKELSTGIEDDQL